jgi:hypothetical protein
LIVDHGELPMISHIACQNGLSTSLDMTDVFFHYAPLHYLVFIARSETLYSKVQLLKMGFDRSHFRRTSQWQDERRGFANYVHLTMSALPPILRAKLDRGFPHFEVRIPAARLEQKNIHLCRYNIARSRYLRGASNIGPPENGCNGRYYGRKLLPTAETAGERAALLAKNHPAKIEVLARIKVDLPNDTRLVFFHKSDVKLAQTLLRPLRRTWQCEMAEFTYEPLPEYAAETRRFLKHVVADPSWRGDGLDFDKL